MRIDARYENRRKIQKRRSKGAKKSQVFQSDFESSNRKGQASARKEEDRRQVALDKAVTKLDVKSFSKFAT